MNQSLKSIILEWHNKWPIDYWWRKKYNISFGSPKHREANIVDMLFEFGEDKLFEELAREAVTDVDEENYSELTGDILKPRSNEIKMSEKEVDHEFDNLDLNNFNS